MARVYTWALEKLGRALGVMGLILRTGRSVDAQNDPALAAGSGAAAETEPNGSAWFRTDGSPEFRKGGSWLPFLLGGDSEDLAVEAQATANGTGVTANSEALSVRKLTLSLEDVDIALSDNAGTIAYGGLKIADLPEGAICILGAVADLDITKSSAGVNDDWDGDFALGTVTASDDASLSSTEANIIPSTATPQASSGATTANGQSTATECPLYLDGTTTPADVYLNFLVDDADHDVTSTPCNLIANGTVTLTYAVLGDY